MSVVSWAPCDPCPRNQRCEEEKLACFAFYRWVHMPAGKTYHRTRKPIWFQPSRKWYKMLFPALSKPAPPHFPLHTGEKNLGAFTPKKSGDYKNATFGK